MNLQDLKLTGSSWHIWIALPRFPLILSWTPAPCTMCQGPPAASTPSLFNERDAAPVLLSPVPRTMTTYDEYGMPVGAYSEPESFTHQTWRRGRAFVVYHIRPKWREVTGGRWHWRRMFTLVNILVVLWIYTLYWGERNTFKSAVKSCDWEKWEDWVGFPFALTTLALGNGQAVSQAKQLTSTSQQTPIRTASFSSPTPSSSTRTHTPAGHGP